MRATGWLLVVLLSGCDGLHTREVEELLHLEVSLAAEEARLKAEANRVSGYRRELDRAEEELALLLKRQGLREQLVLLAQTPLSEVTARLEGDRLRLEGPLSRAEGTFRLLDSELPFLRLLQLEVSGGRFSGQVEWVALAPVPPPPSPAPPPSVVWPSSQVLSGARGERLRALVARRETEVRDLRRILAGVAPLRHRAEALQAQLRQLHGMDRLFSLLVLTSRLLEKGPEQFKLLPAPERAVLQELPPGLDASAVQRLVEPYPVTPGTVPGTWHVWPIQAKE